MHFSYSILYLPYPPIHLPIFTNIPTHPHTCSTQWGDIFCPSCNHYHQDCHGLASVSSLVQPYPAAISFLPSTYSLRCNIHLRRRFYNALDCLHCKGSPHRHKWLLDTQASLRAHWASVLSGYLALTFLGLWWFRHTLTEAGIINIANNVNSVKRVNINKQMFCWQ